MNTPATETQHTDGASLVFLAGCPRSGTTWLQRLLAAHPRVRTGQESDLFTMYIGPQMRNWMQYKEPAADQRGGIGLACHLTEDQFMATLKGYLQAILGHMLKDVPPGCLFLEKTPSHALFVKEIHALLPKARFINVIRDPRAVAASLIAASKGWGRDWAPKTGRECARMWMTHVEAFATAAKDLPPALWQEVNYEALLANQEKGFKGILACLGLDYDAGVFAPLLGARSWNPFAKKASLPEIPIRGEIAQRGISTVIEPQGFNRKVSADKWREELSAEDLKDLVAELSTRPELLSYDLSA